MGLELSNATSSICWIFVPLFDEAHNPKFSRFELTEMPRFQHDHATANHWNRTGRRSVHFPPRIELAGDAVDIWPLVSPFDQSKSSDPSAGRAGQLRASSKI